MRGADALIDTLIAGGVELCFANPGTSEMQLVDAIDARPEMRAVLGLHEIVCSGAADGYARMAGKPALVLLHLGPGLSNAMANLHNAAKAGTPVVVVVGDHPKALRDLDPPLASDIESMAKGVAKWIGTATSADDLAPLAAQALAAAMTPPYGVAVLIAPNDACWSDVETPTPPASLKGPKQVDDGRIDAIADAIDGGKAAVLLGGDALTKAPLAHAAAIGAHSNVRVFSATFCRRIERGAGRAVVERLPYFPAQVLQALHGIDKLILAGARTPLSFFAYPGMPYELLPEGCDVVTLADEAEDAAGALARLAKKLGCPPHDPSPTNLPPISQGALTTGSAAGIIARHLPDGAIVSDDSTTAGLDCYLASIGANAHDWLNLTGGAIGQGLPAAVGAALAEPGRRVFALQGDGAGLYSLQALWTQAREKLAITNIIFANRKYHILEMEMMMARGGGSGASPLFDLSPPTIDWVKLAEGFGVPAIRVDTVEALDLALKDSETVMGPVLIEAVIA